MRKNIPNTAPNLLSHYSFGLMLELHLLRSSWIAAWLQSSNWSEADACLVPPCCKTRKASFHASETLPPGQPLWQRKYPYLLCVTSAWPAVPKRSPEELSVHVGEAAVRVWQSLLAPVGSVRPASLSGRQFLLCKLRWRCPWRRS